MAELSPEEIQLRANQVTDEVSILRSCVGLEQLSGKITVAFKDNLEWWFCKGIAGYSQSLSVSTGAEAVPESNNEFWTPQL